MFRFDLVPVNKDRTFIGKVYWSFTINQHENIMNLYNTIRRILDEGGGIQMMFDMRQRGAMRPQISSAYWGYRDSILDVLIKNMVKPVAPGHFVVYMTFPEEFFRSRL